MKRPTSCHRAAEASASASGVVAAAPEPSQLAATSSSPPLPVCSRRTPSSPVAGPPLPVLTTMTRSSSNTMARKTAPFSRWLLWIGGSVALCVVPHLLPSAMRLRSYLPSEDVVPTWLETYHDYGWNVVDEEAGRFTPSRDGTSWSLPSTAFTPHILKLVDFAQKNRDSCDYTSVHGKYVVMALKVGSAPSVALTKGSRQRFERHKIALAKVVNERTLPSGTVTLAVSMSDKNEMDDVCFFANSAPDGANTVFNFEDILRWAKNKVLPKPFPWDERDAVPVFRGKAWGFGAEHLRPVQEELKRNLQTGMAAAKAGDIFFRHLLNASTFHRRAALVHFSKLHPELVNARLSEGLHERTSLPAKSKREYSKREMWAQNATNGMHRLLPFHEIPAEDYYTKHQTHVVMGGHGAAFRLARTMGQTVAVVLQDYPYKEWFTHLLEPFVHYIPLDQGLSNLTETLHWVRDHPAQVHQIAKNGKAFYDKYLSFDRMGEFYHELIFRLMLCCGSLD